MVVLSGVSLQRTLKTSRFCSRSRVIEAKYSMLVSLISTLRMLAHWQRMAQMLSKSGTSRILTANGLLVRSILQNIQNCLRSRSRQLRRMAPIQSSSAVRWLLPAFLAQAGRPMLAGKTTYITKVWGRAGARDDMIVFAFLQNDR